MRCRKGDMAYIIHDVVESEIGRVVDVLDYYLYADHAMTLPSGALFPAGHYWLVSAHHGLLRCDDGDLIEIGCLPDQWLLPIRPDDLIENTSTDKELIKEM